jgi:hypothetical protein
MRRFTRLPFSPFYRFTVTRDTVLQGHVLTQGQMIPEAVQAVLPHRLLELMYTQRRIMPIMPEAPAPVGDQGGAGQAAHKVAKPKAAKV